MIRTDFGGRSFDFVNDESLVEYQPTVQNLFAMFGKIGSDPSDPQVVADAIWTAVTDGTDTLRYRAGADAEALLDKRKAESDEAFFAMFRPE